MIYTFTVTGPPRTKKTHNRIITIPGKDGGRGFQKILPSKAYVDWFKNAMSQAILIRTQLREQGAELPIERPVKVKAIFYRQTAVGDLIGYEQSLADWMQADKLTKPQPGKIQKLIRTGAGVIDDDKQIVGWGDSRLDKDAASPRIEVEMEVL